MNILNFFKKLLFLFLFSCSLIIIFILLDILIARNIYNPLSYVYSFFSFLGCQQSSLKSCQKKPQLHQTTAIEKKAMVVSTHHEVTKIGVEILKSGGNAIDAAVAVGYALAVSDPCCGNLGGGGFMLIRLGNGKKIFIDFRETAPSKAHSNMYLDKNGKLNSQKSKEGYLAVATPGTVKGLNYALAAYGKLTRKKVILPAIKLAEEGFVLTQGDIKFLKNNHKKLTNPNVSKIFKKSQKNYQVGDKLIQKDLGATLRLIAQQGDSAFYQGIIAKKIIQASEENGGILTQEDFTDYQVQERTPLTCTYRRYEIITAPPPGGGTVLCQMLNILEGYSLNQLNDSSQRLHLMLSAMLYAYADRNKYFGDPDFIDIPLKKLLSKKYATQIRKKIPQYQAQKPSKESSASSTHTTHYSVLDSQGNAVSVTYTINSLFGAGIIASDTGFFLNNEMNDFTLQLGKANQFGLIQGEKNAIEPKKRPLSSMSPTIVTKNNQLFLITGSPGGSTIPTTILQVIMNFIDFKMSPDQAVNTPKIHYQGYPNLVLSEPNALSSQIFLDLWQRGYRVIPFATWGAAESIYVDSNNNIYGIHDSRNLAGEAQGF